MKIILLFLLLLLTGSEALSQNCNKPNSLISVTKRKSGKTEYVIFNLKKPVTSTPALSTVSPPFTKDGSGNKLTIKGCRYKQVKFENIDWMCTITNQLNAYTYYINQVKKTGQFEGVITYIIGCSCNTKSVVSYSYDDRDIMKFVVRFKG